MVRRGVGRTAHASVRVAGGDAAVVTSHRHVTIAGGIGAQLVVGSSVVGTDVALRVAVGTGDPRLVPEVRSRLRFL